jgi:hypothetical protein
MIASGNDTIQYDHRRTLIIGDVNTGKTRLTEQVLKRWTAQGRGPDIVLLDLAPESKDGIGGRLNRPAGFDGLYLTTAIVPPRLTARHATGADALARANAQAIEMLFEDAHRAAGSILVINDVTLYLQAGRYERLLATIQTAATVLINAYYGHSFPDYDLSRQERRLTERLIQDCDRIIRLPDPDLTE